MAKTQTKTKPTGKSVATTKKTDVAASNVDVTLMMKRASGRGVSTAAEDNIIPLIYILQAQSPQALKQKSDYIKGAVAGQIWPRGSKTLIDGEEDGLPVIPVAFKKSWVEWRPDRGGYAGRFDYDSTAENKGRPDDATWVEDPKNPGMGKWTRTSGNVLVETREHAVMAKIGEEWTGCVISMSGSNHTASRAWMGLMKGKKIPDSNDRAPSFAYAYCLKTVAKSNDKGDWYGWQAEDGMGDGEVTFIREIDGGDELFMAAYQLNEDFESGRKVADAPLAEDDGSGPRADDDDKM